MNPRTMRRAARRRVAIEASKAAGCNCALRIVRGHKDEQGFNHIVVAHDSTCPLCEAPSLLAMYMLPECTR